MICVSVIMVVMSFMVVIMAMRMHVILRMEMFLPRANDKFMLMTDGLRRFILQNGRS